ncbi:MAG: hypothetical protein D6681_05030 [Calditrichaeota bacterium]|nr:MAG: hypothetical protein D6681_05030 [Calditrichota bacterium]
MKYISQILFRSAVSHINLPGKSSAEFVLVAKLSFAIYNVPKFSFGTSDKRYATIEVHPYQMTCMRNLNYRFILTHRELN